jgi:hypothetical protein
MTLMIPRNNRPSDAIWLHKRMARGGAGFFWTFRCGYGGT